MYFRTLVLACFFAGLTLCAWPALAEKALKRAVSAEEIQLNAVLASVDGKPITLYEVCRRLQPPRRLSLEEAALDLEARRVLDVLITQRLIEAEAEQRKLKVGEDELKAYLNEVARRNLLSPDGFEQALRSQGIDVDDYKEQIKIEILKSKLTAQLVHSSVGVTQEEIEEYLRQHPEFSKSGSKVKLRQVVIAFAGRSQEQARSRMAELREKFKAGASFAELAQEYSDGPEAGEGGLLGVVAEEDLNPALFDAVFSLKEGEISPVVESPDGLRVFFLEKRFVEKDQQSEELYQEVRKNIERRKLESQVENFFSNDLMKAHSVDRKI